MNASALVTEIDRGVGVRARRRRLQLRRLALRARCRAVPASRDRRVRDLPRAHRRDVGRSSTRLPHVIGDFTWTGLGLPRRGRHRPGRLHGRRGLRRRPARPGPTPTCWPSAATSTSPATAARSRTTARSSTGCARDPYIAVHRPQHHGRPTARTPWSWNDAVSSWTWDASRRARRSWSTSTATPTRSSCCLDGASVGRRPASASEKAFLARFETEYRPGRARRGGHAPAASRPGGTRCRTAIGLGVARGERRGRRRSMPTASAFVEIALAGRRGHDVRSTPTAS